MCNEPFQEGDVVVEIGNPHRYVVRTIMPDGQMFVAVILGHRHSVQGTVIDKNDPNWVKAGKWDFANKCEIDDEEY